MTLGDDIAAALAEDDPQAASALATAQVKKSPQDAEARMFLAELSILLGDLSRAETQARLAATAAPDAMLGIGIFRQHLRALHARDAWWQSGALPTFPNGPSALSTLALRLNVALRETDGAAARTALHTLEDQRGAQPGTWNGTPVADLRDLDDRLPHAIEALTGGGHYLWLDFADLAELTFGPATRPLDTVLPRARVRLRDGSAADIRLPAIYPAPMSAAEQLGRTTDFDEPAEGVTTARGQRCWLAGDDIASCLETRTLTFLAAVDKGAA
ncbi:type VI secretion system accessory protein TagJ [uncultured Roseobacter sp.]|uniref:type VI secretion system accessory protein TagJ n=1 Tax=uncultured Roseobacter sp. TaxID=114847 RepID=UPI0026136EBE|nr:type VI secretion system accessory protein TagJ [uncultured Roseobacter sp.]